MNHSLTDIVSLTVNEASQVKSILNIYILYTHASNKVPKWKFRKKKISFAFARYSLTADPLTLSNILT